MKKIINSIFQNTNLWYLLFLFVLYMVFNGYLLRNASTEIARLSGGDAKIVDLQFAFDTGNTARIIQRYSPEARDYYKKVESGIDIVYPIVYSLFFAFLLAFIYKKKSWGVPSWIVLLPFITMTLDLLENLNIILLLRQAPDLSPTILFLCELCKTAKWISFGILMTLIVYGVLRLLTDKLSQKKNISR